MTILLNVLLVLYVLTALLMMLVILMQRPKSEGLGAAFGGGVTENIFGAQTTNVLTKFTSWLAGAFFVLTFLLAIVYAQRSGGGGNLRRELLKDQPRAAATTTAPLASPTAPSVSEAPIDPASSPAAATNDVGAPETRAPEGASSGEPVQTENAPAAAATATAIPAASPR